MVSATAHQRVLADIVGNAHVRDAVETDAVGGVVPSLVAVPGGEDEAAAVLGCADRDGLAVVVRSGGTKLDWAPAPRRCDLVLSTSRLDRVVEHEPGDLVCVVQAGLPLVALQAALVLHGQALMLDPNHGVAATLGGIVAAGAWGPLRTRFGTARDLVIGARFVLADGTVGHSGGKVVKNVAGYDVAKLLVGSHGTLAVITELSLRLHPLPAVSRTVVADGLDAEAVQAAWRLLDSVPAVPSAVVAVWPDGVVLVRIDGGEGGVAAQVEAVVAALRSVAPSAPRVLDHTLDDDGIEVADHPPLAVIGVPRTQTGALLRALESLRPHAERAVLHPALGLADVQLGIDTTPEQVGALRAVVASLGGHLTLRRPTAALQGAAWPDIDPVAADLMRAVKHAVDPRTTLAPGRLLGGI